MTTTAPPDRRRALGARRVLPQVVPDFVALDLLRVAHDPSVPHVTVCDCLISGEPARVDPPMATFFGVHAGLCMGAIAMHGGEEQKAEWLPKRRQINSLIVGRALTGIGAFV